MCSMVEATLSVDLFGSIHVICKQCKVICKVLSRVFQMERLKIDM